MNLDSTSGALESPRSAAWDMARKLQDDVLQPIKAAFVGKDEVVDLMGVCLVGGENLFLHGPPGTAKSALVREMAMRIEGNVFDYLLTRFTEPNELFGPFDIRKLREGELITNTEGMLPEASLVFLDELLNANSAVLNSLLMVLHERVFRRGRETRKLPLLMVVGASNRLPEDDALNALFDRFLLRVRCENVPQEMLPDVLAAGWRLDQRNMDNVATMTVDQVRQVNALVPSVELSGVLPAFVELVNRLRHAGIPISDRRAVKLQRAIAASAVVCGREAAQPTDLWVLRYIWDTEEQQEILRSIVQDAIDKSNVASQPKSHPRATGRDEPEPETLARDLDRMQSRLSEGVVAAADRSYMQDQLGVLAGRCQWVSNPQQRQALDRRIDELRKRLTPAEAGAK